MAAHIRIARLAQSFARVRIQGPGRSSLTRQPLVRTLYAVKGFCMDVPLVNNGIVESTETTEVAQVEDGEGSSTEATEVESTPADSEPVLEAPPAEQTSDVVDDTYDSLTSDSQPSSEPQPSTPEDDDLLFEHSILLPKIPKNRRFSSPKISALEEITIPVDGDIDTAIQEAIQEATEIAATQELSPTTSEFAGKNARKRARRAAESAQLAVSTPPTTESDKPQIVSEFAGKNARKRARRAAEAARLVQTPPTTEADEAAIVSEVLATATPTPPKIRKPSTRESKQPSTPPQDPSAPRFKARWRDLDPNLVVRLRDEQIEKRGAGQWGRTGTLETPRPEKDPRPRSIPRASEKPRNSIRDREGERQREKARTLEPWQVQQAALRKKFPEGWKPRKRLSPDALEGIRALHAQLPEQFTTHKLAEKFEISPEAIRRILRTKWKPTEEEEAKRQNRWFNRGTSVWERYAELGLKPPKKWRDAGVGKEAWEKKKKREREMGGREVEEEERGGFSVKGRSSNQRKVSDGII